MDLAYENSVIYFPDAVFKQVVEGDFYESLFFLTQRFMIERPSDMLLLTCIDSLKKIILTRVTFCQKPERKKFTRNSLVGITRLMRITRNSNNVIIDMIQFNIKMLANIHLRKFRKFPEFSEWLGLVMLHIEKCLFRKPFKFYDTEVNDCFELI